MTLPLAGSALLVAAEFSTLYEVRAGTVVPAGGSFPAGHRHGYALALIATGIVVATPVATLRGSRPAPRRAPDHELAGGCVALLGGALILVACRRGTRYQR